MLSAPLRRALVLACALVSFSAVGAASAQATTYVPNLFGDPLIGGADCTPPESPSSCSLRGAVATAKDGDTIKLAAGTYELSLGSSLDVKAKIAIAGAGPTATTIEQTASNRVIEVDKGLTLSGVTVTGGHLTGNAGPNGDTPGEAGGQGENVYGVGIEGAGTMVLTDVAITGNVGTGGPGGNGAAGTTGGIGGRGGGASGIGFSGGSTNVLVRVALTGNTGTAGAGGNGGAGSGGAGGAGGPSGSSYGAGISSGNVPVTISDSLIAGNLSKAGQAGDGANATAGAPAGKGGQGETPGSVGLFTNGVLKLTNVTITGNHAEGGRGGKGGNGSANFPNGGAGGTSFGGQGGGVGLYNGATATFASVTLAGNSVGVGTGGTGGAAAGGGSAGSAGFVFAPNGGNLFVTSSDAAARGTIFADGVAATGPADCSFNSGGTLKSLGHNLTSSTDECFEAAAAGDRLGVPAGLGPLADNGGPTQTMALLPGSAAIDAGEAPCLSASGQPLATDQRGLPRGNPCDIGAFELQPPAPPPPPVPTTASLSNLKVKPKKLRNGQKATISFVLSAGAKVNFELRRKVRAKKGGKLRLVKAGGAPKAFSAVAGKVSRTWKPRGLAPGAYQLRATPEGGKTVFAGLRILPKLR